MKSHFRHVGKPAPPRPRRPESRSSAKTRLRIALLQHLGQALVAAQGNVVLDLLRIDLAAFAQHDLRLATEEIDVRHVGHVTAIGPTVGQSVDDLALAQMVAHDGRAIVGTHVLVEDVAHDHHRAARTRTQAADLTNVGLALQSLDFRSAAASACSTRRAPEAMQLAPMQMRIGITPASARSSLGFPLRRTEARAIRLCSLRMLLMMPLPSLRSERMPLPRLRDIAPESSAIGRAERARARRHRS